MGKWTGLARFIAWRPTNAVLTLDMDSVGLQLIVRQTPRREQHNLGVVIQVQADAPLAQMICGLDRRTACQSCKQQRISFLPYSIKSFRVLLAERYTWEA